MRNPLPSAVLAVLASVTVSSAAPPVIEPVDGTIGRNLQAFANIHLTAPAPHEGLVLTITSDDPSRLLLSTVESAAGTSSIQLRMRAPMRESGDFWLQALSDSGKVTYTVSSPGLESKKGTVTLVPSAVVVGGPFRSPTFPTTTGAEPSKIIAYTARLDSPITEASAQPVAGGKSVPVELLNSNPKVGSLSQTRLTIGAGQSEVSTYLTPLDAGETAVSVVVPPGFASAGAAGKVTAVIRAPGLGLTEDVILGQNLQQRGTLSLGEAAPAGGLDVTITSSDPAKLLLSVAEDQVGSASIKIHVPPGELRGSYFLQALANAGSISYAATAKGYRSRPMTVELAPSGVVICFKDFGPPDRAEVLHANVEQPVLEFATDLSPTRQPTYVDIWTVQLDPIHKRGADITVQPLRAGAPLKVKIKNSNPKVGTIDSEVIVPPGKNSVRAEFKPLAAGKTILSVETPPGFTTPSNSTRLPVTVK